MNLIVIINIKNMKDTIKDFVQQTSTLRPVLYRVHPINQVPYFILNKVVTDSNLTRLLLRKNKQTNTQTKQNKTKQNKTKQNKTKQKNKTKQNKTKQNKTKKKRI